MKFYGRTEELSILQEAKIRSHTNSQFTVLIGRRRVGKTRLILHSLGKESHLYFFVSKKAERLLCKDYVQQIENNYGETIIGEVTEFQQVFQIVCRIAKKQPVNLVIDEFQEFANINAAIFSDLQRDWDLNKEEMNLNLIICGSVQSMMNRIFLDAGEPLFGRASNILRVDPFSLATLRAVVRDHHPEASKEDLISLYTITGGVAQYVEALVERDALTYQKIVETIFRPQSIFLEEGRNALIQEMGKEHTIYFSILSLIANGFTSRPKIESVLQKPIGGYLTRLERVYGIIKRKRSIFSKENNTDIRFYLIDNFFRFWFRFIFKYQDMVEAKNFPALREIVHRDYRTYAGLSLEQYLREQLREQQAYTKIGTYWERGNRNEIDIVAVNELTKTALIVEVKWQRDRVNLAKLELKAENLVRQNLKGYAIEYRAFGVEDLKI